ncbi:MAG: hypothetical protein MJ075_02980 [Oscillospiraceae bacterium]|nr:hypothetical protein [Oscillospiraceae bacterium]
MAKSVIGKIVKATLGLAAVTGAAAAAGVVYGLTKWAKDDDSRDIKMTTGGATGVHISKTDDGKFLVDTKYEWTDEDYDDDDEEEKGIIIDLSSGKGCCEETPAEETCECTCCEEAPAEEACECGCCEEAPAEEACECGCCEEAPAEESCGCGCEE